MGRLLRLASSEWLIPALVAIAVFLVLGSVAAPNVVEFLYRSDAGILPDDAATTKCQRCGRLSVLAGRELYRCPFCRHEQGNGASPLAE